MKNFILSLIFAATLVILWFGHGNLMGGGEAGVLFYNLSKISDISFPAWGNQILGGSSGITVSSGPIYQFLSFIQKQGISGQLIQAVFFFIILILTMSSMNFLYCVIFNEKSSLKFITSGLFYLLNPYSLMNIWNRFLPNTMVFYAVLPLVLGLYIKAIKEKKLVYAILASLFTAIFAYGFAAPAQTLIFLGLVTVLFLYELIIEKRFWFVTKYYLVSIVTWGLFNFWWIFSQISFRFSAAYTNVSEEFFSSSGNLDTFMSLSRSLGQLKNLFLLKHGTFFSQAIDLPFSWPLFYDKLPSLIIEWGVVLTVLYLVVKHLKNKWIVFLLLIFAIGIFGSKGSTPPLGELFQYLFEKITYIQFFRNPFEKIGILLPLALSPLVGFAFGNLYHRFGKKILVIAGLYLLVFLGFPFWTSLVFTSGNPPANDPNVGYQVIVPEYYKQADEWLSSQPGQFRFMSLPLGGEGIFYKWPKGYVGVEQSGVLFSTPSISYNTTIPFYHQIAIKLQQLFMVYKDFYKVADLLNARYILFRPDFDFKLSGMRDPSTILGILENRLAPIQEFGPLKIYSLNNKDESQKIYPAVNLIATNKTGDLEDVFATNFGKNDILVRSADQNKLNIAGEIVHSSSFFEIDTKSYPQFTAAPDIFPYVSRLPDDPLYPFVLLKEKIALMAQNNVQDRTGNKVALLGKRLMEVKLLKEKGDLKLANKFLNLHLTDLAEVLNSVDQMAEFKQANDLIWRQDDMFNVFSSHLYILKQLNETEAVSKFKKLTSEHKILPYWDFLDFPLSKNGSRRVVYQFDIPIQGKYELKIPKTLIFPQVFSVGDIQNIQLDNLILNVKPEIKENYLFLGSIVMSQGIHEISFAVPEVANLAGVKEVTLDTQKTNRVEIPVANFDPFLRYEIGFGYLIDYGDGLNVDLVLDNDPTDMKTGKIRHSFSKKFNRDSYSSLTQFFSFITGINDSADTAKLDLWVNEWNNCLDLFQGKYATRCKDKSIYDSFNRPSRIKVSNIHVYPKFPTQAKLVRQKNQKSNILLPIIDFEKIDSTKYKYSVKNALAPFVLVFSELFDAGWRNTNSNEHFLVNGYANAWKINKTGDFAGEIEFYPQRLLRIGYLVSGTSVTLGIVLVIFLIIKQKRI